VRRAAHARLETHRARRAVEEAVERAIAADLAEAEYLSEQASRARREARALAARAALDEYAAAEKLVEGRLEAVRAAVAAQEAERRAEALEAGAQRVGFRADKRASERSARAEALSAQAHALELERAALLERLVASVPYRERIEEIGSVPDAARAAGHTASSAASAALSGAYAAYLKAVAGGGEEAARLGTHDNIDLAAGAAAAAAEEGGGGGGGGAAKAASLLSLANARIKEQGLFPKHGFSDRQVTSDKRFRLVSSVWAAGIAGSVAARTAVRGFVPTGRGSVALARGAATIGEW
jgi:hypothetical protein